MSARFWIVLLVFEVLFGLAVFAATRAYYVGGGAARVAHESLGEEPPPTWPNGITRTDIDRLSAPRENASAPAAQDPAALAREADDAFNAGRYGTAADLYRRLLDTHPGDVQLHNNLGLTLQYLGRTQDALRVLREGVAADPTNQRIWLTLGYVYSQSGSTDDAYKALTNAMEIGDDAAIRKSARSMRDALP